LQGSELNLTGLRKGFRLAIHRREEMKDSKVRRVCLNWLGYLGRCTTLLSLLLLFAWASAAQAQTPIPAATGSSAQPQEGFASGWGFGVKFEGSSSGDGTVTDLATGVGYNFSRHFGVDVGIPYYFVGTPSSVKQKNPSAVSGHGLGNIGADLKWNFPGHTLNYASSIHFGAPTGDTKKGFSTGHATWNWSNHFEHGLGNFTPYLDAGVGNTVTDTRFFHRPFTTFGYDAQFEGGMEFDAGPFSVTASAYDVAPWGSQTVISKVFRCSSGVKCSANGKSKNRRGYTLANVQAGSADLVRDNGFNFGAEVKPRPYLDLEIDYSRSVPLQLNSFSFGVSVEVSWLLRPR
jgi:hypothetical protein